MLVKKTLKTWIKTKDINQLLKYALKSYILRKAMKHNEILKSRAKISLKKWKAIKS